MHDFLHRAAVAGLLIAGVLTAASPLAQSGAALTLADALWPLVMYGQLLVGVLGAGLVLAAFVPQLRLAMVGAAIVSKAGFLAIAVSGGVSAGQWFEALLLVLLLGVATVLSLDALRQARWDGVLPLRQES